MINLYTLKVNHSVKVLNTGRQTGREADLSRHKQRSALSHSSAVTNVMWKPEKRGLFGMLEFLRAEV
jgi:hypothetical protein